jgi:hypothetical protein
MEISSMDSFKGDVYRTAWLKILNLRERLKAKWGPTD